MENSISIWNYVIAAKDYSAFSYYKNSTRSDAKIGQLELAIENLPKYFKGNPDFKKAKAELTAEYRQVKKNYDSKGVDISVQLHGKSL